MRLFKAIIPLVLGLTFMGGTCYAGMGIWQEQGQIQTQGQIQGQSMYNKIKNENINLNAVLTNICNKNANKNSVDNQNNQNIVFEDKREYVVTPQITFANSPQGYNEKMRSGRRFVSVEDQTMFSDTWTKARCQTMLKGAKFATKTKVSPSVKKGEYKTTDKIKILTKDFKPNDYVEIALAIGQAKGDSNSRLITAEAALEGMELGADTIYIFGANFERWFKHRGIGNGASIADATNSPDTVYSGLSSFNLGSQRFESYPYQKMYLLKKK